MKTVHIKFFILVNAYSEMFSLKIKYKGKVVAKLKNEEHCALKVKPGEHLKFLYSFPYRTHLVTEKNNNDEFVLVTYYFREYFPGIFFDLFKKILIAHKVSENEFNRASIGSYKKRLNPREDFEQDIPVLAIGFLLSLIYIFLPFIFFKNNENNQDLSFFIGVMGVIGFAMLIGQKKIIQLKEYKARVLVFSALSVMLDIILPLSAFMKFTLLLATGILALRVWRMKAKKEMNLS
jgi:hypothetical protein